MTPQALTLTDDICTKLKTLCDDANFACILFANAAEADTDRAMASALYAAKHALTKAHMRLKGHLDALGVEIERPVEVEEPVIDMSGMLARDVIADAPDDVRKMFEQFSRENTPFGMATADLINLWWPLKQRQVNENHPEGPLEPSEQVMEFTLSGAIGWAQKRLDVVSA